MPLSVDGETDFFVSLTVPNNSCRKRLGTTTLNAHQCYFTFVCDVRTAPIAFPSGEGGAPQGVTDEENVAAQPSPSGELFAPQKRRLMEAGLPARIAASLP